jgi:hypothetical protein
MDEDIDLKEVFGVPKVIETSNNEMEVYEGEVVNENTQSDIDSDYEFARKNIKKVLEDSENILSSITQVAKLSESPRAFEVVSTMMKTIVDANKDLIKLHKEVKDIKEKSEPSKTGPNHGSVTNNAVFVGDSSQLLDLVRNGKGKHD